MADECDKSENNSKLIDQDGMLCNPPCYVKRGVDDYDDSISNGKSKANKDNPISNNNVKSEAYSNKLLVDDDDSISNSINENNKNIDIKISNIKETEGDYFNNAIHKDGSGASTGARKKTTQNQTSVNGAQKSVDKLYYNKRALTKLASTYKLEMFEKNLLIIYNFINVTGYKERDGTIQDADELENTFKMYGFEVEREGNEDLTRMQLLKKLDEFDKRDFTEYGCVAVAVMTHGTWGGWLMAKDLHFSENEIINRLKARTKPTLVTKPVVLIIQACRGSNSTKGVMAGLDPNRQVYKDQTEEETHHYYLPVEADMLVIHSSYVGKPAFRPKYGTWFIQTLCKKIHELAATEDLESIMVEVKREVAINKEYRISTEGQDKEIEYHKQIPTVTSTLFRKLYLFEKSNMPFMLTLNGNATKELLTPIRDDRHVIKQRQDECACLLDHLDYFKNLLMLYAAENVYDTQARCLLQQATGSHRDLNFVKFLVIAISSFLKNKLQQKTHTKYIYWYGDDSYSTLALPDSQNISVDDERENIAPLIGTQSIIIAIRKFKMNYMPTILIGIGTYTAIHVVRNIFKSLREN